MIILALVAVPLAAMMLVYVQRERRSFAALLAALGLAVQMLLLSRVELRTSVSFGELQLVVDELAKNGLIVLTACTLVLTLCAWYRPQGDDFIPFLLLLHAAATAVLVSASLFVSALLLAALGATQSLLLSRLRVGNVASAAMRPLVMFTISSGCLVFALLLAGLYRESPNTFVLTKVVVGAMSFGFALSFAIVPFHAGLLAAVRQVREGALGAALLFTPIVATVLMLRTSAAFPWLLSSPKINEVLATALAASALAAALLALTARESGTGVVYVSAGGMALVAALGVLTYVWAPTAALFTLLAHLSGVVMFVLVQAASAPRGVEQPATRPSAWAPVRRGILTASVAVGALTMAGLPPSAAFPGRWLLYRGLASSDHPFVLMAMVAASMLIALAIARIYYRMWADRLDRAMTGGPGALVTGVLLVLIVANVVVGLAPAPVYSYLSDVVRLLTVAPF